jgi:uncharacterized protein (TIGR01777 family)
MRFVIAGSSGFLGSRLVSQLEGRGHDVVRLVRRDPTSAAESRWDPYAGLIDDATIAAADVVVNLAGAPTLGNPHSRKWSTALRESRVVTTRVLAERIAAAPAPPAFVAGNAVGWYGDHGDEVLTEETESRGDSLMTGVCREWQEATGPAVDAGARVCLLRTAPILGRRSAPMKQLLPLFKLGLGTRLGDGRQYFPVISLRDWLGAAAHLCEHASAAGPFNLCSPVTPTNKEFTDALAESVGRRARLVAPRAILERAAGALAPEALGSLRTEPAALLASGFAFQDEDVREVIAAALR